MSGIENLCQLCLEQRQRVDEAEAKLKEEKEALAGIESALVERFAMHDVQHMRINGHTLYRHKNVQVSVKAEDRQAVLDFCRSSGLDELVDDTPKVQPQRLKSWVKEQIGEGVDLEQLPEALRSRLRIFEGHEVRVRKA